MPINTLLRISSERRGHIAAVFGILLAQSLVCGQQFRIMDHSGSHTDLVTPNGKTILRYMYARDKSDDASTFDTAKVYAHVLSDNGEDTLTKGAGGKFPHHRGIFIGWNKQKHDGKSHDLWHVRNTAQEHREFLSQIETKNGAEITSSIDWLGSDGKPVIAEERTYAISAEDGAHAIIDFTSKLTAVGGDVELNGDPEHAGVQFRPSQKVAENKSAAYTFHQSGIDPKKDNDLPWVAEEFRLGDQWWSVQHMSHPNNPKGARWSAYRDYGRFGPFTVVRIPEGDSVTFRYRFRVTREKTPPRDSLQDHYQQYAK